MTVSIKIRATRGTTTYEFETIADSGANNEYTLAEKDATDFEAWLSAQPERQAQADARALRGA